MKLFFNKTVSNWDVERVNYFSAVMLNALSRPLNPMLMLRQGEEALCQSFRNYFTTKPVNLWTLPLGSTTTQEVDTTFFFPDSQVSQVQSGEQPETMSKSLTKTLDEIIISPTPASCLASSEVHRPQPLGQSLVRLSKQEKLKGILPTKDFGNSCIT